MTGLTPLKAAAEGVAGEAVGTPTDGVVCHHVAEGVDAAGSRTRVDASVVDASLTHGTVGADGAGRAAGGAVEPWQAGAHVPYTVGGHSAEGVGAAGVGLAGGLLGSRQLRCHGAPRQKVKISALE